MSGRGAYYKAKYGGGGRGRGRGGGGGGGGGYGGGSSHSTGYSDDAAADGPRASGPVRSAEDLKGLLRRIDGAGYGAYRDMEGAYEFGPAASRVPFRLVVDRTQSDPFAPPSRMHVVISGPVAGFPAEAYSTPVRATALADYLARSFVSLARRAGDDQRTESGGYQGKKGGEITMDVPSQHVLPRTNVLVRAAEVGSVEARFTVALPARGRSIEGAWCARILLERLPDLVGKALVFAALDGQHVRRHILSVEDQESLRAQLKTEGLVAFVRNGAILPRKGGDTDEPMDARTAIPFQSPPSLERTLTVPNAGAVTGMGIPQGITLIVGGGFHGKSTLLKALEVGIYPHVPGDGRDGVVVDFSAVKIRAEDGRSVAKVNVSPFINNLPFGSATDAFSTPDASGSTSQAANIIEALEIGTKLLIMDEDLCATNFMIRDAKMMRLVAKDKEPITPFLAKASALYTELGVSSILVMGGSGDYFDVASHVVMMDSYRCLDKTAEAKAIAQECSATNSSALALALGQPFGALSRRLLQPGPLQASGKVTARGKGLIQYGDHEVNVSAVEQLVEVGQTRAIAAAMRLLGERVARGGAGAASLRELVEWVEGVMNGAVDGMDVLEPNMAAVGNMARPRTFELAAAINRFRALAVTSQPASGR